MKGREKTSKAKSGLKLGIIIRNFKAVIYKLKVMSSFRMKTLEL